MNELLFALENGIEVEYQNVGKGIFHAIWNNGGCVVELTEKEYRELTESRTVRFALGHDFHGYNNNITTFEELLETLTPEYINKNTYCYAIRYGLDFNSKEEAETFANTLPKSWGACVNTNRFNSYSRDCTYAVWFGTNLEKGVFTNKSAANRVKRFLAFLGGTK